MSASSDSTLVNKADQRLFRSVILNPNHVLHRLIPEVRRVSYHLRSRAHGFKLLIKDDRNCISRLHILIYCSFFSDKISSLRFTLQSLLTSQSSTVDSPPPPIPAPPPSQSSLQILYLASEAEFSLLLK